MTGLSAAIQSGSILLREGLEAILVIAALAAFLRKAGGERHVKWLYAGALAAVAASFLAAAIFEQYFGGAHDDRLEAVVMGVAAVLLLYMSGWLFLKQNPASWTAGLKVAAERAITTGTTISLAALAFLSVFREGAETVLFLHAAARADGGYTFGMFAGLGVAAVVLIALYVAMQWLALRLPLRPVFVATSALLFVMGLRFVGLAIQECQEQVLLPVHSVGLPQWLIDAGMNASWEAIGAQIAVGLVALLSTVSLMRLRRPTPAAAA